MSVITDLWKWVTQPIINWINNKVDWLWRVWQDSRNALGQFFSDQLGYVEDGINWVTTSVGNQLSAKIADLKSGVEGITETITGFIEEELKPIRSSIVSSAKSLLSNFEEGIKGVREEVSAGQEVLAKYFEEGLRGVAEVIAAIPETLERLTRDGMEALAKLPFLFEMFKKDLLTKLEDYFTIDDKEIDKVVDSMKESYIKDVKRFKP